MWNSKKSVNLSIVVCCFLAVVLSVLAVVGPDLFKIYMSCYRGFAIYGETLQKLGKVFCFCFYPSAIFAGVVIYSLLRLLFNIKAEKIFINDNVKYLRTVSWCCFAVAIITLVGGFFYLPFLFVTAAGGFVGMLLRVLKNVMQNAVILREENDLTI